MARRSCRLESSATVLRAASSASWPSSVSCRSDVAATSTTARRLSSTRSWSTRKSRPYTPTLKTTSTPPSTSAYQSVRRERTESIIAVGGQEKVARAAAGVDQLDRVAVVDLAAEALHVDLDQVGEGVEAGVPDVFGDVRAAEHLPRAAGHELQQRILLRGEVDDAATPG